MTNLSTPRGALFDLDGVIVDSEGIYTEFWQEIDREFPTGVTDFAHVIKGNTLEKILDSHFSDEQKPEILKRLKQQENDMVYRLFPGVTDLLRSLRDTGWKTAIVTSSNPAKMEVLFSQLPELRELVDTVITDKDVNRSKPDPEGYLKAAAHLGCNPTDCLVFEDSLAGLEAGRRAGATVVGIATTNAPEIIAGRCDILLGQTADFKAEMLM